MLNSDHQQQMTQAGDNCDLEQVNWNDFSFCQVCLRDHCGPHGLEYMPPSSWIPDISQHCHLSAARNEEGIRTLLQCLHSVWQFKFKFSSTGIEGCTIMQKEYVKFNSMKCVLVSTATIQWHTNSINTTKLYVNIPWSHNHVSHYIIKPIKIGNSHYFHYGHMWFWAMRCDESSQTLHMEHFILAQYLSSTIYVTHWETTTLVGTDWTVACKEH